MVKQGEGFDQSEGLFVLLRDGGWGLVERV